MSGGNVLSGLSRHAHLPNCSFLAATRRPLLPNRGEGVLDSLSWPQMLGWKVREECFLPSGPGRHMRVARKVGWAEGHADHDAVHYTGCRGLG